MTDFVQIVLSGAVVGVLYALLSAAYAIVYAGTGFVNFSFGALAVLAGYFGYVAMPGSAIESRALVALVVVAPISVGAWLLVFEPIVRRSPVAGVISAFALAIVIQEAVAFTAGNVPRSADSPFGSGLERVGGVVMSHHAMGVLLVGGVLLAATIIAFSTRSADVLKAVHQDREMAMLLGVRARRVALGVTVCAGVLVVVAGVLAPPAFGLTPYVGTSMGLVAFVGAVLGGLDRVGTAVAGSLILGVAESLFGGYISSDLRTAFVFGVFILVLIVRPVGLFVGATKQKV